jgi:hypothetical protein
MFTIDLNAYRSGNTSVFSGRPRGEAVRKQINLDKVDTTEELVKVVIPGDVFSVNTSFFLGLFGESVRGAGSKENFLKRFTFECPPEILEDVSDGIERALREKSVLEDRRT